jgi:hypothetical protein
MGTALVQESGITQRASMVTSEFLLTFRWLCWAGKFVDLDTRISRADLGVDKTILRLREIHNKISINL